MGSLSNTVATPWRDRDQAPAKFLMAKSGLGVYTTKVRTIRALYPYLARGTDTAARHRACRPAPRDSFTTRVTQFLSSVRRPAATYRRRARAHSFARRRRRRPACARVGGLFIRIIFSSAPLVTMAPRAAALAAALLLVSGATAQVVCPTSSQDPASVCFCTSSCAVNGVDSDNPIPWTAPVIPAVPEPMGQDTMCVPPPRLAPWRTVVGPAEERLQRYVLEGSLGGSAGR